MTFEGTLRVDRSAPDGGPDNLSAGDNPALPLPFLRLRIPVFPRSRYHSYLKVTSDAANLVMHADVGKWVALGGEAYHLEEAGRRLLALSDTAKPAAARAAEALEATGAARVLAGFGGLLPEPGEAGEGAGGCVLSCRRGDAFPHPFGPESQAPGNAHGARQEGAGSGRTEAVRPWRLAHQRVAGRPEDC